MFPSSINFAGKLFILIPLEQYSEWTFVSYGVGHVTLTTHGFRRNWDQHNVNQLLIRKGRQLKESRKWNLASVPAKYKLFTRVITFSLLFVSFVINEQQTFNIRVWNSVYLNVLFVCNTIGILGLNCIWSF